MLISIITPVYNGSEHLDETIQSVLRQSFPDFEHILVDDASTDNSRDVIARYNDPRIVYLRHSENQGADAARNTGIRAANGRIIAFLDQDDILHPQKLQVHSEFLYNHPDVGFTYNGRFVFIENPNNIQGVWVPPNQFGLVELLTSTHLISPSDMVVRREWIEKIGLWDDTQYTGNEMVFLGRLILDGCKFSSVEKVLNYRRYYENRKFRDVDKTCREELAARQLIFSDPRCPREVLEIRNLSFANNLLAFTNIAFAQKETTLGQSFVEEAIKLNPAFLQGEPPDLVVSFALNRLIDNSLLPEKLIRQIFDQLPPALKRLRKFEKWAVAHRYFVKGMGELLFGESHQGKQKILKGIDMGFSLNNTHLGILTQLALNHWIAFGSNDTNLQMKEICTILAEIGEGRFASRWRSEVAINLAFRHYAQSVYSKVPAEIVDAIRFRPASSFNRGLISIFVRSLIGTFIQKFSIHKMTIG